MSTTTQLQDFSNAGVHFGYTRSRRHPSAVSFIYASKNRNDIFDLEQTAARLEKANDFLKSVAVTGRQVLFIGGKNEVSKIVEQAAVAADMPYCSTRWIGGTLTNYVQIKKRLDRLEQLRSERDRGEREMFTKKERVMLDREIENLEFRFAGITSMKRLPAAVIVVDPRHDSIAVKEAVQLKIPVIAIANTDCDFDLLTYPVPANDATVKSVALVLNALKDAYRGAYVPTAPVEKPVMA
jgi:small subunit ribosomal protein S2